MSAADSPQIAPEEELESTALDQLDFNFQALAGYLAFVVGAQGATLHGLTCMLAAALEQLPKKRDRRYSRKVANVRSTSFTKRLPRASGISGRRTT
jgi:hypothetical protein